MKKWVFGCLGLAVVVAVGAGIAGYHFVYRPTRAYLASFAQLKVIPELERQISNQATFTPPADGTLNQDRVDRFLRAQQTVFDQIGTRLDELSAKYRALQSGNDDHQASVGEAINALKDLAGVVVEAKRVQVAALNAQGFSLSEYEWTRARVYEALGVPVDATLQRVIRDAAQGKVPSIGPEAGPSAPVPPRNRELLAPHVRQLTERAPLAFFGL